MATTPPSATRPRTPPAPLHGAKYDTYEPYSTRRSSRIRAKEKIDQIVALANSSAMKKTPMLQPTPRTALGRQGSNISGQTLSPPMSPVRRGTSPSRTLFKNGMLPTPAKTPRKRDEKFGSTGRVLFTDRPASPQEAMPSPRRSRVARSFTMDDEPDNDRIQVYTDSVDRVPEVDEDADNPFVVRKSARKSKISSFTERLSDVTSGKTQYGMSREIDEAVDNDEGMVYTFRGRKIYRKFEEKPTSNVHFEDALPANPLAEDNAVHRAGAPARERLPRSAVKPRLLFPPREASPPHPDEEADTDIDELALGMEDPITHSEDEMDELAGDATSSSIHTATPRKTQQHSYLPATPPTSVRKTRHSGYALTPEDSPKMEKDDVVAKGARLFDEWKRTKPAAGRTQSMKRGGEEMVRDDGKRARSSARGV